MVICESTFAFSDQVKTDFSASATLDALAKLEKEAAQVGGRKRMRRGPVSAPAEASVHGD